MTTAAPIIRANGEGDRQSFLGGGLHTWKLLAEETGGAFFLFEDVMVRGKATPLHRHPEAAEMTYVLDGEIVVNVDGVESRVGSGGMSYVPSGTAHAFHVVSDTARLLTMQTPGIGQEFYRGASEPTTAQTSEVVDVHRLLAVAQANPRGIEVLGPPPFEPDAAP